MYQPRTYRHWIKGRDLVSFDVVVKEKLSCAPCERAECIRNYECMRLISPDAVFDAAKMIIEGYE